MKIFKSMPTKHDFFQRYAALTHSLTKISVIAQGVTGVCELGILYSLFYPTLNDVFPDWANTLSIGLSLFCASLLQIGLKKVFPYSVRAILFKRFKGLDLPFSIAVFILTIALLTVSVFLSYKGSQDIGTLAVQVPKEKTTTATDSTRAATERAAAAIFRTDSTNVELKFLGKSEAISSDYNNRASGYDAQASRAKGSIYKAELSARANAIRSELRTKLAVLQSDKASELEAKATERKASINKAVERNDKEAATILTGNETATAQAKAKQKAYGGYIGYFTLFAYLFFLCTFTLNEIWAKGSGIDSTPQPHQRHFAPSLFAEFMEAVKARIDTYFRTKIYAFADNTLASPLPNALNPLYDYEQQSHIIKIETQPSEVKTIRLPSKVLRIAAKKTKESGTATDVTGEDSEPKKSRKIGFFKDATDTEKTDTEPSETAKTGADVTAAVMHEKPQPKTKNCEWCNNSFEYVVYNKKYCCEDCKKQAWTAKTGVNFDLELKKKERQKKK